MFNRSDSINMFGSSHISKFDEWLWWWGPVIGLAAVVSWVVYGLFVIGHWVFDHVRFV